MFAITDKPLDSGPLIESVSDPANGAIVTFTGTVRRHSRGREVDYLEYEAYQPMAERVLREIGEEAMRHWNVKAAAIHRVGRAHVGEASVIIAVSAPHRQEAFEACCYIIDQMKQRLPVWKMEVSPSGERWWVEGQHAGDEG